MRVKTLDESVIGQIGHAFGYYDYGIETGLVSLFSGRDDVAAYICGYVRAALQSGLLHTVGEGKEAFIAYKCPGERASLRAVWPLLKAVCQSMNLSQMLRFVRLMQKAGPGTEDQFKKAKGELVFSTVLSVVSILLGLVPFYCMYRVICLFAAQTVTKQAVVYWCGWALAAYAGKIVCFTLSTGISHHAAYNILEGLRLRLVERFLHAPLGEVQKHSIGEIKSILVDKIENIRQVQATVESLEGFLEMPALPEPAQNAALHGTAVELHDVRFAYTEGGPEVLHGIDLTLPQGYDTPAGEAGKRLSGGEKQRISIARAMLKDAPIILLDEATASIDPENEHLIQSALSELTRGKTIITIAHRLATIEQADQILVVDDGRIVEKGTHAQLIAQPGRYQQFVRIREKAEGWKL